MRDRRRATVYAFDNLVLLLLVVFGVLALLFATCGPAAAQDPAPWSEAERAALGTDAALWLARGLVAEGPDTDWAMISHVLRRRWTLTRARWPRQTFVGTVRAYCAGLDVPRTARQRWIHELDARGRRPRSWGSSSWERYRRETWEPAQALAAAFLRGEIADPCPEADAWGGRMDAAAFERRHPRAGRVCQGYRFANITWRLR